MSAKPTKGATRLTYTDEDGREHVFRKPTIERYAEFQADSSGADADRFKAFRLLILDCAEDRAAAEALIKDSPALVMHDLGLGAALIKLAGAGRGSFSFS